jgi:hypothetical protein
VEPALRAIVRSYEYEDWPRGRIVFDQSRDLFIIYADRKLLTPATIARLETQFQLPEERTEIQSDLHYKSKETPNARYIDGISQPRKRISRKRRPLTWRSQIRGCAWWIAGGGRPATMQQCNRRLRWQPSDCRLSLQGTKSSTWNAATEWAWHVTAKRLERWVRAGQCKAGKIA